VADAGRRGGHEPGDPHGDLPTISKRVLANANARVVPEVNLESSPKTTYGKPSSDDDTS
jgi:hypothetical protein